MTMRRAEELKSEWTDRFVTVRKGVAELRRFDGLVGQVKTVNMNCRALVEFDSAADISWYDIDPQFLVVTAPPVTEQDKANATDQNLESEETVMRTPAETAPSGGSPLDLIRQQAAAKPPAPDSPSKANALTGSGMPRAPGAVHS